MIVRGSSQFSARVVPTLLPLRPGVKGLPGRTVPVLLAPGYGSENDVVSVGVFFFRAWQFTPRLSLMTLDLKEKILPLSSPQRSGLRASGFPLVHVC